MRKRCLRSHLAFLAAFVLFAGLSFGQGSSGTISGRVVDPSGAAIAGAEVRVINQVDRHTRNFTTSPSGEFVFPSLDPGTYTVAVKVAGFKALEKTDLHLSSSDSLGLGDVKLEVGAVTETVEVKAQGATVETATAERAGLLDSKQITDLMARGRDVMSLLQLMPGVVDDSTGSDTLGQFSTPTMGGVRSFYNSLNIDGISGNTARGRTAEAPINMDAIAEVKVLQNSYSAESGTSAGGVINLVTKSGTMSFHGGAYYYNRNEAFNANNFFNNRQSIARQRYRYNTEGSFLGGPIYIPNHFNTNRQKLFFFFSQEYLPNQQPNSVSNFTVPTELERQGNFSQSYKSCTTLTNCSLFIVSDPGNRDAAGKAIPFTGNIIPQNRMDPNAGKLLSIFPLPNATNPAITKYAYNFQIAGSEDIPVKQEILRVDYNVSEKGRAWFRASGFSSDNTGLNSAAIQNKWGPAPVDYAQTMPNLGASFTYVFSPSLVNEAIFGLNLWTEQQKLSDDGLKAYQRATYGINIPQSYPSDNPLGVLPAMTFSGVSSPAQISYDGRFPMVDDSTAFSFTDNLSKVWKSHLFKGGIHLERVVYNQYHQAGGNSFPGAFAFGTSSSNPNDTGYAYSNAFLGYFNTYTEATNRVDYAPVTHIAEGFIQDSWKVRPNLTLNIGVRLTYDMPQTPNNDNAGNFVPSTYDPSKAPVLYRPAVVNGAKVTIDPRTGIAVPAQYASVYAGLIVPGSGSSINGVVTPTTPGFPRAMRFNNGMLYAPRVGINWDPMGQGKFIIHAGGGFFYNPRADAGTLGNLFFNPPAIFTPTQYYGTVSSVVNGAGLLSPSNFSRDIDANAQIVTSYQFNFGIQREVGWGTVVDVSYVGSLGRHLGEVVQLNNVPYGAEFLPQNQNPQTNTPLADNYFRKYMGYGNIPQQIFQGNSSYHSLQIEVDRRFARTIHFGVSYTRSKAMDYAEGDSTSTSSTAAGSSNEVAQFVDRKVWNYGIAGYDRPNILTFHVLYDVPKLGRVVPNRVVKAVFDGWQISNITSFVSGAPLGVSMGFSPAANLTGGGDGERPLMVGNPNLPADQRTFDRYFNVSAFAEPIAVNPASCTTSGCPPITWANFGDMPAKPIRGPGRNNFNTSVFKNFRVKEKVNFQIRAEAYNTFNHTQFSGVDTTITYNAAGVNTRASSGQLTSARDPRIMQFAARITF